MDSVHSRYIMLCCQREGKLFFHKLKSALTDNILQRKKIFYYNSSISFGEEYVNESTMTTPCETNERSHPCGESPSFVMWGVVNPPQPYFHLQITDLNTNKSFYDQYVNVCTLEKEAGLKIFVRFFRDQFKESSNFEFGCPLPRVRQLNIRLILVIINLILFQIKYYLKSFPMSPRFDLLLNFFALNHQYKSEVALTNKVGRKMEEVLSYTNIFEIVEVV